MINLTPELERICQDEVVGGNETNKRVMEYCKAHGLKFIPVLQQVRERITNILSEHYRNGTRRMIIFEGGISAEPEPLSPEDEIDFSHLCDFCGMDTRLGHKMWCKLD